MKKQYKTPVVDIIRTEQICGTEVPGGLHGPSVGYGGFDGRNYDHELDIVNGGRGTDGDEADAKWGNITGGGSLWDD